MYRIAFVAALSFLLIIPAVGHGCQGELLEYRGVVTAQLLPAMVLQVNRIVEDPGPGESYISEVGILVEVEENPDVMANWTVVSLCYYRYATPKTISYEIFSEQHEITVENHAVSIRVVGDLSAYIDRP